jgi:hypothetical protein
MLIIFRWNFGCVLKWTHRIMWRNSCDKWQANCWRNLYLPLEPSARHWCFQSDAHVTHRLGWKVAVWGCKLWDVCLCENTVSHCCYCLSWAQTGWRLLVSFSKVRLSTPVHFTSTVMLKAEDASQMSSFVSWLFAIYTAAELCRQQLALISGDTALRVSC